MKRRAIVFLTLTWLVLGTSLAAWAAEGPAAQGPVEVSNISIQAGAEGETLVDIAMTRSATFRVSQLQHPARLVVDLEGARNATHHVAFAASSPFVKRVRVGQHEEGLRVVADLQTNPAFDIHAIPGGIRMELKARTQAQKPHEGPAVQAVVAEVTPPVAAAAKTPEVEVKAPETTKEAAALPLVPAVPKLDFLSTLPSMAVSEAAPRPPEPAPTPEVLRAEKAAKTLGADLPLYEVVQGSAPGGQGEQAKYTGEPISLNLKDVDLKDFFRLIHEISGLNIIVDPNVAGSVTMVLDSVPWDQALDIVLKNNHLGKVLEGNVLRIATMVTLTQEQEAQTKLEAARVDAMPLVTIFRPVNYAKAATISTMLKTWVGGGALTKRGNVLTDDRTNTLIISDIQSQIPIIQDIITKLDKKAKQVAIEARVVLATSGFTRDLQAALSGAGVDKAGHTVIGGSTGTGSVVTPSPVIGAPSPNIITTATSAAGYGAIAVANAAGRYTINVALAAAETKNLAKTISRPTIVTQNNQEGMVMQGVQVPIQTNINNTISVQYANATLQLRVTPQVTDDGNIFMIINVNNASVGAVLTFVGPSINTQQATTQVLVPDGGTVVFGGVTVTQRSKSATYVPLIGSIPIIGHFFKTSNVTNNDQELLFFVSPKILT
ncbi:MAG: type IV pilus secretin PilQ [Acidobacteriia bacterium]|nr:type IV pilus secretin PilQ [Terriglobia bacterium]